LDPIAQGILKYVDLPNRSSLSLNQGQYLNNTPQRENTDQFSIRADYSISPRDQLFARYSYASEAIFQPASLSTQGVNREPRPQIVTFGFTHTFTPTLMSDLRLGLTRLNLQELNKYAYTQNIPAQLGIVGQEGLPAQAWDVPNIS